MLGALAGRPEAAQFQDRAWMPSSGAADDDPMTRRLVSDISAFQLTPGFKEHGSLSDCCNL